MTQRQTLYAGVSRAAWGYFFLYFDIRLGQLNILPEFGAYLLFLSAIHLLEGQRRDLALLRPLGWLLAAWSVLGWPVCWTVAHSGHSKRGSIGNRPQNRRRRSI